MTRDSMLHVITFPHGLGTTAVAATRAGVRRILLDGTDLDALRQLAGAQGLMIRQGGRGPASDAALQIRQYLQGRRRTFRLDLDMRGTPFQQSVWRALRRVPFGRTVTYGQLASRVGRPAAARAVGSACGANPLPIVIPCHRVLAAGSRLGGFSGGLGLKRALLALEGMDFPLDPRP